MLILGGTTEASDLARRLDGDVRFGAILSLAGRTQNPAPQPIPVRTGGFGGVGGLAAYLREQAIAAMLDATHPFAAQMTRHALQAATLSGTPFLAIVRPPWRKQEGDSWHEVETMAEAATAIGAAPRRVLLTVGQQELAPFSAAPQHHYVVRSVEPATTLPPSATVITARGPFAEAAERALLLEHRIDVVVTKNAGGRATRAKLDAARALGLPVVIVRRPALPPGLPHVTDVEAALAWLEAQAALRGE